MFVGLTHFPLPRRPGPPREVHLLESRLQSRGARQQAHDRHRYEAAGPAVSFVFIDDTLSLGLGCDIFSVV